MYLLKVVLYWRFANISMMKSLDNLVGNNHCQDENLKLVSQQPGQVARMCRLVMRYACRKGY
jgi:hypothetical protein